MGPGPTAYSSEAQGQQFARVTWPICRRVTGADGDFFNAEGPTGKKGERA